MIIKLKDGAVNDIYTGVDKSGGCPTCDFGATYCTDISFHLTSLVIFISWENGCISPCFAEIFKTLAHDFSNMTEKEFAEYLQTNLRDYNYFNIKNIM